MERNVWRKEKDRRKKKKKIKSNILHNTGKEAFILGEDIDMKEFIEKIINYFS